MAMTPQASAQHGSEAGVAVFPTRSSRRSAAPGTRIETDSLGSLEVPSDAYWGIHTARAMTNFPISRRAISNYPDLIRALARVKQAAARANKELGVLDAAKADIIDQVCEEIVG